jgi:hypothetical protein
MSKTLRLLLPMLLAAGFASAAPDVVVLRGGARVDLKQPPVRQGNNVLLTRRDGTLLSVPYSEIDQAATAAAKSAAKPQVATSSAAIPAPQTPAEAARVAREGPKARVRLTDADVGHYLESPAAAGEEGAAPASPASGGGARVDVADYSQSKRDDNLIVKGVLRNLGTQTALNVSLSVMPLDEKGNVIDSVEASVSNGTLEAGKSVNFSATVPVGTKTVSVMRFSPRWITQAPPAPAPGTAGAAGAPGAPGNSSASGSTGAAPAAPAAAAASRPPVPTPQPYGQGTLYAAPAPNAPSVAPADGKTGYIPGAASPENQPKPPE